MVRVRLLTTSRSAISAVALRPRFFSTHGAYTEPVERTCQHEHGGRLSGAVVAEKRRDFAFVHVQVEVVDGRSRLPGKYL